MGVNSKLLSPKRSFYLSILKVTLLVYISYESYIEVVSTQLRGF